MLLPKKWEFDRIALFLAVFAWVGLVIVRAWVHEDAYVTFRVVDNLVNGYGLRWNTYERVQAYTNPLWLFLHVPFSLLSDNIFVITIIIGVLCSAFALWFLLRIGDADPLSQTIFLVLPLCFCKAIILYSTSGLETSLNHLLVAVFCYQLVQPPTRESLYRCVLIVALACISRLDMIVLLGPPLALMLALRRIPFSLRAIVLGGLPLVAWLVFAEFYYGSPLPNTYYAKMPYTDPSFFLWWHGVYNLVDYSRRDPWGFWTMLLVIPLGIRSFVHWSKSVSQKEAACLAMCIGVVLNIFYIVMVGADYLTGRFWSVPTFAAMCCFAMLLHGTWRQNVLLTLNLAFYGALALLWGAVLIYPMSHSMQEAYQAHRPKFLNNWSGYVRGDALVENDWTLRPFLEPHGRVFIIGNDLRRYNVGKPVTREAIGITGYLAGPEIIIIDTVGLSDPLLSHLPPINKGEKDVKIGHRWRDVPRGYINAILSGNTDRMDPQLAEYYKPIRFITTGPLFDMERLKTLIDFQLGEYDNFRNAYVWRHNIRPPGQ